MNFLLLYCFFIDFFYLIKQICTSYKCITYGSSIWKLFIKHFLQHNIIVNKSCLILLREKILLHILAFLNILRAQQNCCAFIRTKMINYSEKWFIRWILNVIYHYLKTASQSTSKFSLVIILCTFMMGKSNV